LNRKSINEKILQTFRSVRSRETKIQAKIYNRKIETYSECGSESSVQCDVNRPQQLTNFGDRSKACLMTAEVGRLQGRSAY
jgi:hypothetical protein